MDYYITKLQHDKIEEAMPQYLSFSYKCEADGSPLYIHNTKIADLWNFDIDAMFGSLYEMTYEEFLASRLEATKLDAYYAKCKIIEVYQPLGREVINRFMARNNVEGIDALQSAHAFLVASEVINELSLGAIETAVAYLNGLVPDDMTESYHWVTQDRIDAVLNDIANLLGEVEL